MPKGSRYRKGDDPPLIQVDRKALQTLLAAQDGNAVPDDEVARVRKYLERKARDPEGHHYRATTSLPSVADRHAQIAVMAAEGKSTAEIAGRLGVAKQTVCNHLSQWRKEREANPVPDRGDYRERLELIYRRYMEKANDPGWKHSQGKGDLVLDPDGNPEQDVNAALEALNGARRVIMDMVNMDGIAEPRRTLTANVTLIEQAQANTVQLAEALGLALPRGTGG